MIDAARMKKIEHKLISAKLQLLRKTPFLGNLILSMPLVMDENMPYKTMGTDGEKILFDPTFVENISLQELKGTFVHEVLHCALLHIFRRQSKIPEIWNFATDFSINWQIRKMEHLDVKLPNGALYDQKYEDWTADKIYDDLMKGGKSKQNCSGNGNNGNAGFRDFHGSGGKMTEGKFVRKMVGIWESLPDSERRQGHVPSEFERLINELKHPTIPWEKYLVNSVESLLNKQDYSWRKPSRIYRGEYPDAYFPSFVGFEANDLVIAIDTSGSVQKSDLTDFASEIDGIIKLARKCYVMPVDAEVHAVYEVTSFSSILDEIKFLGGGGTSFIPPFKKVEELNISPECFIYFTDLEGTFPAIPPYPTFWVATKGCTLKAPFGETLTMENL